MILELKERAAESQRAPEPKAGKTTVRKATFAGGRAGTMAFDNLKGPGIETTPQGLAETTEPMGTAVERKLTSDANKSTKTHPADPMLKASSNK